MVLALLLIVVLPFVLNYVVTREKIGDYVIAGEAKDWVSFWIIYLSSIASLAMVVITWCTLKQSKLQNEAILNQNKKQLDLIKENARPYIRATIEKYLNINATEWNSDVKNDYYYMLFIENVGVGIAHNVMIQIEIKYNSEDLTSYDPVNKIIQEIKGKKYLINGKEKIDMVLIPLSKLQPTKNDSDFNNFNQFINKFEKSEVEIKIQYDPYYKYETKINIEKTYFMQTTVVQCLNYIRMSIDSLKKNYG